MLLTLLHPWLLVLAVGSYTEDRGLNQGAASSTGGADGDDEPNKKYWFLNIKRYRRFFNVDTEVHLLTKFVPEKLLQSAALAGHMQYQSPCVFCTVHSSKA